MYTSFRVRGFRCFQDLSLERLERVNLIAGKNGVGKTALLEALFLHCGPRQPMLALQVQGFRGFHKFTASGEAPWDTLFNGAPDGAARIELISSDATGKRRSQQFTIVEELSDLRSVPGVNETVLSAITEDSQSYPRVLRLDYFEDDTPQGTYWLVSAGPEQVRAVPLASPAPFPAHFLWARRQPAMKEMAERFGKMEKAGRQEGLLDVLKIVQPRLRRVATIVVGGDPVLHGETEEGRLTTLQEMGDGLVRLAEVVLAMSVAQNGIVLVDEFENGLHHGVLERLWAAVAEAARRLDVQIFATTHSWECIKAAHRALSDSGKYDLKFHRLERIKGVIKAVDFDQELVQAAIEMRMEVR